MSTIVVCGGGYAGTDAARVLARELGRAWDVVLVEPGWAHQIHPRMLAVVGGRSHPSRAEIPYGEILPRRVRHIDAEVLALDLKSRQIRTSEGTMQCDSVLLALGSQIDFLGVPGAREYSHTLRSVADAVRLRDALFATLGRVRQVRVAVVGAGYTATEVAGELSSWNGRSPESGVTVTLIAADDRLLARGNERLGRLALARLRSRGVQVRLAAPVTRVDRNSLTVAGQDVVPFHLLVWVARRTPVSVEAHPALRYDADGRVRVDDRLLALGMEGVYVAGDQAAAIDYRTGETVPASAQLAVQEGGVAARNILAEIRGERSRPFRPRNLGEVVDLGGGDGVAEVGGVTLTGRAAVATKSAALARYLYRLGGAALVRRYLA